MATTCTTIFELPASMSCFLYMPTWGMRTAVSVVKDVRWCCCFGGKRCEMVGHIPTINCSAMIAVFVYTLEASNCTLPAYRECSSIVKCIHLIKGVSYAIKLCAYITHLRCYRANIHSALRHCARPRAWGIYLRYCIGRGVITNTYIYMQWYIYTCHGIL